MRKNFGVSIILPNYNSHLYLKETLKSVINQSFKNWELIIVDDKSNIQTKKILNNFKKNKKIKIFFLKSNRGAAYCRNLALKKVNYPFVAFLDSDDVWKKNKLKLQLDFMKKNDFQFTYTNYETFGEKKRRISPPKFFNFKKFIHNTSISTSTIIVRRDILKGVNFTNTEICEDYYFKCKLLKKINRAYCLDKFLTFYRIRKKSLQSNYFKNVYWIWKINKDYNKLNFLQNFFSLFLISLNSIKKYGGKNMY